MAYYYNPETDDTLQWHGTEQVLCKELAVQYFGNVEGYVWIRLGSHASDIESFISLSSGIHQPFTLITTDGDRSVPSDIENAQKLLGHPCLQMWYTQNHDGTVHRKLKPVPIGLDLHANTLQLGDSPLQRLHKMVEIKASETTNKKLSVYIDAGSSGYGERNPIIYSLRACPHVYKEPKRLSPENTWRQYMKHQFVLSMPGNGLDCHRTWEILFFGSVPIVKRSPLDAMYNNLPVIIVDDWNDIRSANLESWLEYASAFKPARMGYADFVPFT